MGRKQTAQLDYEVPEAEPAEQASEPRAPRRARAKSEDRPGWGRRLKRVLIFTGAGAAVLGVIAFAYRLDLFLASDSHFILPAAIDGKPNPNFVVEGVEYAPRAAIEKAFAGDFGRSIYLIPLAERRRALLAIDWVHEASVSRHWPNRVTVHIEERKPVAFVMLPSATAAGWGFSEAALIDADGVILKPPPKARFSLPALLGISRRQSPALRRARVRQAVVLMAQVQPYAAQISEIDVSDPENITVTQMAQGRPLRLELGNRNYLARLGNFLSHYPDISRRLPNARTFDLRLDDHITARDGGMDGR